MAGSDAEDIEFYGADDVVAAEPAGAGIVVEVPDPIFAELGDDFPAMPTIFEEEHLVDIMDPKVEPEYCFWVEASAAEHCGAVECGAVKREGGWHRVNWTPPELKDALPPRPGTRIQKHHPPSGLPSFQVWYPPVEPGDRLSHSQTRPDAWECVIAWVWAQHERWMAAGGAET